MVVARDQDGTVKSMLAPRFQEAIDEVAMRLDDISSENYLNEWNQGPWIDSAGTAAEIAEKIVAELETEWDEAKLLALVDELGTTE